MATPYDTIDSVFVKQYADTYVALLEQKESKLLSTITNIGSVTGSSFTANEMGSLGDTLGTVTRFGATQYTDASFASRLAVMNDFSNFTKLAIQDLYKLKAQPQDQLLQRLQAKYNRHVDKTIYKALVGSAQRKEVGEDTYTAVALPVTQVLGLDTAVITKKLLIDVRTKFLENECEDEEIHITYNASMLNAILADKELTSADYLAGQMLQQGQVNDFLGMKWINFNGISADGKIGLGVAYTKQAVEFGSNSISPLKIVEVETQNRYHSIGTLDALGAVRVDEKRVVAFKFKC